MNEKPYDHVCRRHFARIWLRRDDPAARESLRLLIGMIRRYEA